MHNLFYSSILMQQLFRFIQLCQYCLFRRWYWGIVSISLGQLLLHLLMKYSIAMMVKTGEGCGDPRRRSKRRSRDAWNVDSNKCNNGGWSWEGNGYLMACHYQNCTFCFVLSALNNRNNIKALLFYFSPSYWHTLSIRTALYVRSNILHNSFQNSLKRITDYHSFQNLDICLLFKFESFCASCNLFFSPLVCSMPCTTHAMKLII